MSDQFAQPQPARPQPADDEPVAANRKAWDGRVEAHVRAYGAEAFADDPTAISRVVRQDAASLRPYLPTGGVAGLDLVHLQCHIGLDTLSWARLGARATGVDFSGEAIRAARSLAGRAGLDARFEVCSNEDAPERLGATFDVVYTSVGVLMWLERLDTWAEAVARLLRPGGVLYVRDSHPLLHALDDERDDDLLVLARPYFATGTPLRFDDGLTYAGGGQQPATTYEWPHSLAEVVQSVLNAGLRLRALTESSSTLPWRALPFLEETAEGFAAPDRSALPLEFSLIASKDA
jgi:SAM-dependent methyltransferase